MCNTHNGNNSENAIVYMNKCVYTVHDVKVDPINLKCLNHAKNIPVVLPSSPIKITTLYKQDLKFVFTLSLISFRSHCTLDKSSLRANSNQSIKKKAFFSGNCKAI